MESTRIILASTLNRAENTRADLRPPLLARPSGIRAPQMFWIQRQPVRHNLYLTAAALRSSPLPAARIIVNWDCFCLFSW